MIGVINKNDSLIYGMDITEEDTLVLVVGRKEGSKTIIKKQLFGKEAEIEYKKLKDKMLRR